MKMLRKDTSKLIARTLSNGSKKLKWFREEVNSTNMQLQRKERGTHLICQLVFPCKRNKEVIKVENGMKLYPNSKDQVIE